MCLLSVLFLFFWDNSLYTTQAAVVSVMYSHCWYQVLKRFDDQFSFIHFVSYFSFLFFLSVSALLVFSIVILRWFYAMVTTLILNKPFMWCFPTVFYRQWLQYHVRASVRRSFIFAFYFYGCLLESNLTTLGWPQDS